MHESSLLAKQANVKNLIYTHFTLGEVDQEASLKEIRKNYAGNVIFGKDLMVISNDKKEPEPGKPKTASRYPIVDTGQEKFFSNDSEIPQPSPEDDFYGQDANYTGNKPSYTDNNNGTITDSATGIMWQQSDSKKGMKWEEALKFAESLELAGHDDWRLPNAKELQSIVDYNRSVQTTGSAAINPLFETTEIKDPEGRKQYPYFWTSTTHHDGPNPNNSAVYIAFGEAQGKMHDRLMDIHGAGAQRSDPKTGIKEDYPQYFGPQGDVRYVFNYVRCVRSIKQ